MIWTSALFVTVVLAAPSGPRGMSPELEAELARLPPGATASVMVHLAGAADLSEARRVRGRGPRHRAVVAALRARAAAGQRELGRVLEARRAQGRVRRFRPYWIANAIAVTGTPEAIRELAARPDVVAVTPDAIDVVPTAGPPEPNVAAVRAPQLWSLGWDGAGADVAVMDTGVDVTHPDLAGRWRGGTAGWFDPYGQHPTPYDPSGHGTWTAGVIVGGDAGGTSVGVAPGARFIAAKIFPDRGAPTASAIHAAFEWILDPDGDPSTADAPSIVNGSWAFGSPGCNLEFQEDVRALRAAGILPVFAAGNFGPGPATSVSPANYPESIAVGAVDGSGTPYALSSLGPSACGGGQYPTLAAPGVDVWTTDLFSWYLPTSGTSISAPHVSGAAALLAGAAPGATAEQLEAALVSTALDLGPPGPDPATGHGLVDALAAFEALGAEPAPPVASADAYGVVAGTSVTFSAPGVLANDGSPSGAPLTSVLVAPTANGTLELGADGGFEYTPASGFSGVDTFRYRAVAAGVESADVTVTLTVTVPRPPAAQADAFTVTEDGLLSPPAPGVLANDDAPAGLALAAALVAGPGAGTLTLRADGSFDYRPSANFSGADAFTYVARDALGESAPATVSLTVTPVNDPPVAREDAARTRAGGAVSISVAANDTDVDGAVQPSTAWIVTAPRYGTARFGPDGVASYTPRRGFRGTDRFTYRIRDDAGAVSNAATVRVTVE
ncbi:MAG TPA: Ig-like domain-containing protein [Anaeromyxobacter sp.]|nr:Ig-like domain-containing protein [Anaeromyxobacter sp.]